MLIIRHFAKPKNVGGKLAARNVKEKTMAIRKSKEENFEVGGNFIRMLMTKDELITEIRTAFKNIKLEEGVGLWEGQGIDDYADSETILKLRKRDERNNWNNIPYEDLVDCESSLSFFDAKGMRFCLPKFLIFDILADEIFKEKGLYSPDVLFTLSYKLNEEYQKNRFSLLDSKQIKVVINFLEYKLTEIVKKHKDYSTNYGSTMDTVFLDNEYIELDRVINKWKQKLN